MDTKYALSDVMESLGKFEKEFLGFPEEDLQWIVDNPREAIDLFKEAVASRPKKKIEYPQDLFTPIISTSMTFPSNDKFIAREKFNRGKERDKTSPKILWSREEFKEWFFDKVEEPFVGSIIAGRMLKKNLSNKLIFEVCGGKENLEVNLFEMYSMIEAQPNGERGLLLSDIRNSLGNIFYIKDTNDILRLVIVKWLGIGWEIAAYPIEKNKELEAGYRIFSRTSVNYTFF